jgi:hypothetical protein
MDKIHSLYMPGTARSAIKCLSSKGMQETKPSAKTHPLDTSHKCKHSDAARDVKKMPAGQRKAGSNKSDLAHIS